MPLTEFRCKKCNKLLGKIEGIAEIACHRCKEINRTEHNREPIKTEREKVRQSCENYRKELEELVDGKETQEFPFGANQHLKLLGSLSLMWELGKVFRRKLIEQNLSESSIKIVTKDPHITSEVTEAAKALLSKLEHQRSVKNE